MRWADLERRQPRLAARARAVLIDPGMLVVVTTGPDGTPRLSAARPLVLDGRLVLPMRWPSPEARDLQRDPRLLVHGLESFGLGAEGEVKVQGAALATTDVDVQHAYAAGLGDRLRWPLEVGHLHFAEVDIHTVSSVRYRDGGDRLVATWPPAVEFVRRASSPSHAGERVPVVDLLDPEGPDAPDGPDDPDHPQNAV